jgi:hypothetical protein
MSTASIAQRPISRATAAAAVLAAVAIGSLSLFHNGSAASPTAPAHQQQTVQLDGQDHFTYTTSGGRVMVGQ